MAEPSAVDAERVRHAVAGAPDRVAAMRDGQLLLERGRPARLRFEVRARNLYFLLPTLTQYRRRALERAAATP